MLRYLAYFLTGGLTVTLVVLMAEMGRPFLSGLVIVFPAVTVISFYFIGRAAGPESVVATAKSALYTSAVVWVPYILAVIYFAPRVGVTRALFLGIAVFLVVGSLWVYYNMKGGP
ncbi:MAG: GlpM family protein [Euryarchaeota archaeon]|nr:GlpM family protein [Euryarchaeota archaeon]